MRQVWIQNTLGPRPCRADENLPLCRSEGGRLRRTSREVPYKDPRSACPWQLGFGSKYLRIPALQPLEGVVSACALPPDAPHTGPPARVRIALGLSRNASVRTVPSGACTGGSSPPDGSKPAALASASQPPVSGWAPGSSSVRGDSRLRRVPSGGAPTGPPGHVRPARRLARYVSVRELPSGALTGGSNPPGDS